MWRLWTLCVIRYKKYQPSAPLLKKAKGILEMENPPHGRESCKECQMVYEMAKICGKLCPP